MAQVIDKDTVAKVPALSRSVCLVANPYKGLPASTMDRDMVTRMFDDERAVE